MDFVIVKPIKPICIDGLVTVHYFEYSSHYAFGGESHDFWEFLYVDKGEVIVGAQNASHNLKKGQIIFHKPGEFHTVKSNGVVAPNLVVASFVSKSEAMAFFENKIFTVSDAQRGFLAQIVTEAQAAFSTPLSDPEMNVLERYEQQPFGAEQLIVLALEQLLIDFVRAGEASPSRTTSVIREKVQNDFVSRVSKYLEENISARLTLQDICRDNLVGRSYLQKVFREKTGGGAMEYFGLLKIDAAKRMIREGTHNFTEISVLLGYNSIHYFSRHFKKATGMTPSEYAQSVKAIDSKKFISG